MSLHQRTTARTHGTRVEQRPPLPAVPRETLPEGTVDRDGTALAIGDLVTIEAAGPHQGKTAEVSGWGGQRGLEVVVDEPHPDLVALPAAAVLKQSA